MKKLCEAVIRRRRLVLALTVVLCAGSLALIPHVVVSYDLEGYLPEDSPSAIALKVVGERLPNLQVYVPDTELNQGPAVKAELAALPYVSEVLWLDDATDLRATPPDMIDPDLLSSFYAGGGPLFQLTVESVHAADALSQISERYPEALYKGEAANQARLRTVTMKEVSSIMVYVLPLALLILLLSTRHWLEPLLFLMAIGAAILVNEGSNILFGRISFITRACSAVLQLAVSIDYAVFLLHRFSECRAEGMGVHDAMAEAMRKAASSVAASAATTVFGFLALLVMRFGLGVDMGLVLAKGVVLSYVSVMFFLPAATVSCARLLEKTEHRPLLPSFARMGARVPRMTVFAVLVLILLVPAYLGQANNRFLYGSAGMHSEGSSTALEAEKIDRLFPSGQPLLLMVPEGNRAVTASLGEQLSALTPVTGIVSYASAVGNQIPPEMLSADDAARFMSGGYERIILYLDAEEESPEAFEAVNEIRRLTAEAFGQDTHLLGQSVVNADLKETIVKDSTKVLLAGALAIFLVLLITFKNPVIPILLLLSIEGSVWLNMSFPYFFGERMNYIGYLIVSSVQLGATVDYGILLAQRYLEGRRSLEKRKAAARALSLCAPAILPPAFVLIIAGYALKLAAVNNGIISQLGEVVGRGAILSAGMVLLVLPHLLIWFDALISKTSFHRLRRKVS